MSGSGRPASVMMALTVRVTFTGALTALQWLLSPAFRAALVLERVRLDTGGDVRSGEGLMGSERYPKDLLILSNKDGPFPRPELVGDCTGLPWLHPSSTAG